MISKLETILIGTSLTGASDPVVQSGVLLARRAGAIPPRVARQEKLAAEVKTAGEVLV